MDKTFLTSAGNNLFFFKTNKPRYFEIGRNILNFRHEYVVVRYIFS